jgi:hypothetical protein
MKKRAHKLNREFSKEEVQMANKCTKNCSISLAIKEMQIKTTLRFHLTPFTKAIIKSTTTIVGDGAGQQEPLYTVGGNVNQYNHYGKQYGDFL